jgi:hypothetical protein
MYLLWVWQAIFDYSHLDQHYPKLSLTENVIEPMKAFQHICVFNMLREGLGLLPNFTLIC